MWYKIVRDEWCDSCMQQCITFSFFNNTQLVNSCKSNRWTQKKHANLYSNALKGDTKTTRYITMWAWVENVVYLRCVRYNISFPRTTPFQTIINIDPHSATDNAMTFDVLVHTSYKRSFTHGCVNRILVKVVGKANSSI